MHEAFLEDSLRLGLRTIPMMLTVAHVNTGVLRVDAVGKLVANLAWNSLSRIAAPATVVAWMFIAACT